MEKQKYDNKNSGAIFKNDRKEKETQPDLTGNLNVNGTDFWVSAWKETSKGGKPYYSIKVNPKEDSKSQSAEDDGTF